MSNINVIKLFVVLNLVLIVTSEDNNVCSTYKGYYNITSSKNCWHNFAAYAPAPEIIQKAGYPFAEHKVTTKDGFILTLFRIPNTKHPNPKKNPVFLQHGLISSASCFVGLGKNSLPFLLADAGYDVWLGNYRGNLYSEGHINLTVKDKKFWDHSLDEMGLIDIPTMINYIRKETKRVEKILYVGHSLGTSLGMIYGSSMPKIAAKNVKAFIFLAPAHKLSHMITPLINIEPFADTIYEFIKLYDLERLSLHGKVIQAVLQLFCGENPKTMQLCSEMMKRIVGPLTQVGPESVPVVLNLLPGGTSIKVARHILGFTKNVFQKYDYRSNNMEVYGQTTPPQYDVSNIEVPVSVIYARHDWLTPKVDAEVFYRSLRNESKNGLYEITEDFGHLDFLFSRKAKQLLYDQVLTLLNRVARDTY